MGVLRLEVVPSRSQQHLPVEAFGNDALLVEAAAGSLVSHLEEQQQGELLHVVDRRDAVVAEDVAVAPQPVDELLGGERYGHSAILPEFTRESASVHRWFRKVCPTEEASAC